MRLSDLAVGASQFREKLGSLKECCPDVPWYPSDSLSNFALFTSFRGPGWELSIDPGMRIADIGAADGDTSFFLESLGALVTIIDNPITNANDCRAILEMRAILKSQVSVQFLDLEWQSWLPGQYDLAFFLGILYHLRNPGLVLNTLASCCKALLLSTMVFFRLDDGVEVADQQLAYFLARRQINNDPTNYWLFTPAALRLLLLRSGWIVKDEFFIGDDQTATPGTGDCRMFCYCERIDNWQDLRLHHDF